MEIVVREFVESDRQVLSELLVVARNAAFFWATPDCHQPGDFDRFTAGERIFVAVADGSLAGFASVWEPDSFLHNLFVHPAFQGRGVGKALLAACERCFTGVPTLKCVKANERARRFYLQQGWCVRSEADGPEGRYLLMERKPAPTPKPPWPC